MKKGIYLDHHATTPVDPEALAAMLPYFNEKFGNAMSGSHVYGWEANGAVDIARKQVAQILNAEAREIIFTSGATESVHLAIFGVIEERETPGHIITAATEHKCVLEVCARAEKLGHSVTVLPVDEFGRVSAADVERAIKPETCLVSLMHGNNEIGTLHPIEEIGQVTQKHGVLFHVDAAQTAGKFPLDVRAMNIDLLSISAHKLYGPKGVGALFVRQTQPRVHLTPFIVGGGQEKGLRGGTHNVPGIVGLGAACEIAGRVMKEECARLAALRDQMIETISSRLKDVVLNGHPTERLCNNVNLTIYDVTADTLLLGLHDVAFSSGSACSSGSAEVSHVLKAIGRTSDRTGARPSATLRFGLGRPTTAEEVQTVTERLIACVERSRAHRPQ